MPINLVTMLERLGMTHKPRFTVEETAEILGVRRDQVMDLLKRGKLIGVKSSPNRWSGVFAVDLDDYIEKINAPIEDGASADEQETAPMGSCNEARPLLDRPKQAAPNLGQTDLPYVSPNPSVTGQVVAHRPTDL